MPDLTPITTFSFGLLGFVYCISNAVYGHGEKERHKIKLLAGMTGISLFLMLLNPVVNEDGTVQFVLERFGPAGMVTALIVEHLHRRHHECLREVLFL